MKVIKFIFLLPFKIISWVFSPVFVILKLVVGLAIIGYGVYYYNNPEEAKKIKVENVLDTTKNISQDIKEYTIKKII